jgi:O-antigen ligase
MLASSDMIRLGSDAAPLDTRTIYIRYALILASITVLLLQPRRIGRQQVRAIDRSWIFLGAAIVVSAVIQGDADSIATGVWIMIAIPFIFGRAIPRVLGRNGLSTISIALAVAAAGYVGYSVAHYQFTLPYLGVTTNPNSMGLLAATLCLAILSLLCAVRKISSRVMPILLMSVLVGSAWILVMTISRTSCIAVGVAVMIAVVAWARDHLRTPRRAVLAAVIAVAAINPVGAMLSNSGAETIAVFAAKTDKASTLNDRDDIWMKTWNEMRLFGRGREYFAQTFGMSAHNSLVEMLGKYGPFAAIALACVALSSMSAAFQYYIKYRHTNHHALTPLIITVGFWTLACGEAMLGPLGGAINLSFFMVNGFALSGLSERDVESAGSNQRRTNTRRIMVASSCSLE